VSVAGHDCDLALVEPEDPGALRNVPPLRFGGLPSLRSTVETYGFPAGGQRLSSTRGVVSRIDLQPYMHSGMDAHLTVQTDAAINPGNSGGPVVAGGTVVGVAFQGNARLDNVGYFIPVEVVRHFLADAADGVYGGYPELGVLVAASLENDAARARAGLAPGQTGVGVAYLLPRGSADGALRRGDVLLSVEGHAVANDGTVLVDGMRLDFGVLVDRKQVGDHLRLEVLRDGHSLQLSVPLGAYPVEGRFSHSYDVLPRYFVYAGLVFSPLSRDLLEATGPRAAVPRLAYELWHRSREEPESLSREPVVLLRRLDHPVNARSPWEANLLVERVNGRTVGSLRDLVKAIEENAEPFHVIEYAGAGGLTVFRREEADRANQEILRLYGIPSDRRL
ncbi:MAG: trypsin-like serine protease, partial [Syntrophobacteraceae bacterium]|nr:trypsin-like serine protease [Syntrophobacteraceae bacterium]